MNNLQIIGRADGPTAIYIASSSEWWIIAIMAATFVGLVSYIIWRRKKKKT